MADNTERAWALLAGVIAVQCPTMAAELALIRRHYDAQAERIAALTAERDKLLAALVESNEKLRVILAALGDENAVRV